MTPLRSLLALTILLLPLGYLQAAEAVLPQAEPAKVGMDAEKLAQIDQRMAQFVKERVISGAVTLVVKDGQIVHLSPVGQADVASGKPMQQDSLFAIASMTKPIAAAAVMILVDEGKLSLDEPVSKYLPEFKDAKLKDGSSPAREITLRDVLTHTSGLGGDQQNIGTLRETARKLAARPLDFEPGSRWQYSPGLSVAGAVVEVASQTPFDKFLAQRIFEPLGMKDTTFNPSDEQKARLVTLYKRTGEELEAATHWINDTSTRREPNPSGGLFSTASDMARFYQMVLNGGELAGVRVLSQEAAKEMTRLQTAEITTGFTPGNGWGLGFCLVREPQGVSAMLSPGTYGHGGAFGTQGWIDPGKKMIFVLMIQRQGLPNADASDIRRDLQQLAVEAVKKP